MKQVLMHLVIAGIAVFAISCSSENADSGVEPTSKTSQVLVGWTGKFIVEYSGTLAAAREAVALNGGVVTTAMEEIKLLSVCQLSAAAVEELKATDGITLVIPNESLKYVPDLAEFAGAKTPQASTKVNLTGDPTEAEFYGNQWNMLAINASQAWMVTKGAGVRVGILDTGGSPDHVDLDGKYDMTASRNFVPIDPYDPFSTPDPNDWQDRHFHGTHVAGTIATNNIGVAGVAPEATLVAVKVMSDEGYGDFAWIIEGIMYAADPDGGNCDVINMSLGGAAPKRYLGGYNAVLNKVIQWAHKQGCLVVCAAGNEAWDVDHNRDWIAVPAQSGNAMAVSATGPLGGNNPNQISCYSNYGVSIISVAAPGGNFDCSAGSWVNPFTDGVLSCAAPAVAGNNSTYYFAAGTSMACPHVAGGAALVAAARGGTPKSIEARLQGTARDLGKKGADAYYGKGFLDVSAAVK